MTFIFCIAYDVLFSAKETDHLSDPLATQYSSDYDTAESQNDGGPKSPSSLTRLTRGPSSEPLPKEGSGLHDFFFHFLVLAGDNLGFTGQSDIHMHF